MNVEIITIGSELLCGMIVNTNAAFLGRELTKAGFNVVRQTSLHDAPGQLKAGLKEALQRSPIVISTGGLGSTCDDLTKRTAADIFDSGFHFDQSIADELERRYGKQLKSIQDQANIPDKAQIIPNEMGTAPGFIFNANGSMLILLPGVPHELRGMLSNWVLPFLINTFPSAHSRFSRQIHLFGIPESDIDPHLRHLKNLFPQVEMGIYPFTGTVTAHFHLASNNEKTALDILESCVQTIKNNFSGHLFESASGKMEEAIQNLLIQKKMTLAVAESCTGGSIAAKLTRIPGASKYFLGGLVPYSNQMKTHLLNIPEDMLEKHGAVSPEVVAKMSMEALSLANSDWSLAVSGIAGPDGGTPEKPVGTVWAAILQKNHEPFVWNMLLRGSREVIIEKTVNITLGQLYALINKSCSAS